MFKELTDKISYSDVEKNILAFWDAAHVFEESIASREGKPLYTFFEGPPTANGKPGLHHIMARTLKDAVCRYKTMQGFQVFRKAGWDTHGLPVEIEVEKQVGITHKDEIVAYGVEKFNEDCRKSVWKYKTEWEQMTREMGYWVDLGHPYVTFHNEYIESIWWALQRFFDEGMMYRGHKIQPYCPRCETPLSSHEVAQGYRDVKDPSVYVKMKVKGDENTSFLVWTTTPWTLISNVGLAVHPAIEYVKVNLLQESETEGEKPLPTGERLILATSRLSVLKEPYEIVAEYKGSDLIGMEYERLFDYHQVFERGWYVVGAEFVTTADGSGIVHMAPAYGEDDYQVGRKYDLPTIHPVDKSGRFMDEVTDFKGMFVKDADPVIIQNLKDRNILYKREPYLHSYPHCWRCSSPLLYYARNSWYISTTRYAKKMIALNKEINWIPAEVGVGRFGNWLEENKDWALSRDRYWGTPLPVWICEECGAQKCVGSMAELRSGRNVQETLDLHKPAVDKIEFDCECGGRMLRTPELIDVWFDSGSMPFAQWHYPFENKEMFEKSFPADFISEGIDQTRGWFYTLHAISSFLFGRPAFKNVLVNELILDKQGQKMSKTKGNTVDPFALMKKYGADATRWYLVHNSPVWRPTLFDEDGVAEVQRKFFSTLVNTYSFFALYANIDGFTYSEARVPVAERSEIDRWILSSLNTVVGKYIDHMDHYDLTKASRVVSDFTLDHLSNWYVRRNRRRFWKSEKGRDKTAAYQTLFECLETISRLMAPIAPFFADELYKNLHAAAPIPGAASVHLAMMPVVEAEAIDLELEHRMNQAMKIVGIVRAMRMKSNLKVRQPLSKIILPVDDAQRDAIRKMEEVILEEINVKAIEFVSDDTDIVSKKAKPNFRTLGQKFGKQVQGVAAGVRDMTSKDVSALQKNGTFALAVNGGTVTIAKEDVEIIHEDMKGWLVESDGSMTVALDTAITPELRNEGFAREFVNRVQNMRKDSDFDITDRIAIGFSASPALATALESMQAYVMRETLCVQMESGKVIEGVSSTEDVNGEQCTITIARMK
ncbi:MAG TPA: isoleucine--tRNA ligase [Bacteroidota bacterium]|nr:isoleucine--tRNA ligase [Bacteroidota bacterium]